MFALIITVSVWFKENKEVILICNLLRITDLSPLSLSQEQLEISLYKIQP